MLQGSGETEEITVMIIYGSPGVTMGDISSGARGDHHHNTRKHKITDKISQTLPAMIKIIPLLSPKQTKIIPGMNHASPTKKEVTINSVRECMYEI